MRAALIWVSPLLMVLAAMSARSAIAADAATPTVAAETADSDSLSEVVVTSRRREERLQNVPDAITALTSNTIVNAGIQNIGDLAQLTPNLNFRDGSAFSAGFYDLRMRGIGQGQQGWPAVAFIVDGVPSDSPDVLTSGSLADVERIEVLRGPQSALYGAGAIAGAINVITKRPTDDPTAEARVYYGNGDDTQAAAAVSGPLVKDQLYGRLSVNYRSADGTIQSASNGLNLDPKALRQAAGRLIWTPTGLLEVDLHFNYDQERRGYAYQDRIPSDAYINDFDPSFDARRRTPGRLDRKFEQYAIRINYDAGPVQVTSITSYAHTRQYGFGDACYDDPDDPRYPLPTGGVNCISNIVAYGSAAAPGTPIDVFQASTDDYDSYAQDLRVSSSGAAPIQWLIGVTGMRRFALNAYGVQKQLADEMGYQVFSNRADAKDDLWRGAYGQASYHTGSWEFTAAGRYDAQRYEDTGYTDTSKQVVIPTLSPAGVLERTQVQTADNFQPKGQISYHFDPDRMGYLTVSKGFRAGYFNTGAYAVPEHTVNYEVGFKSDWMSHRLVTNVALFYINYSDQQTSTVINTPPYRLPVTIPKTDIKGAELETAYRVTQAFTLNTELGYLHAVVGNGTWSPQSPELSGSVSGQFVQPLAGNWTLNAHADVSFHSDEYLYINNTQLIGPNHFVNARVGFERGAYGFYFEGRNLTNAQEAQMQDGHPAGAATRYQTEPRTYGVEVRASY